MSCVEPVIEPVKASSTLLKTLNSLIHNNATAYIVLNPTVGIFNRELELNPTYASRFYQILRDNPNGLRLCVRLSDDTASTLDKYREITESPAVFFDRNYRDLYLQLFADTQLPSVVFTDDASRRHARAEARILVEDHFCQKDRNAEYRTRPDEFFSEDHLYYMNEGYSGFGDYSIVGSRFSEGGFMPRAVAIHCVYPTKDNELYIHHAVSSEDAPREVAALYRSALEQLIYWADNHGLLDEPTIGMQSFRESMESCSFPGLGSVKKWSIMHHLEVVNNILRV